MGRRVVGGKGLTGLQRKLERTKNTRARKRLGNLQAFVLGRFHAINSYKGLVQQVFCSPSVWGSSRSARFHTGFFQKPCLSISQPRWLSLGEKRSTKLKTRAPPISVVD